MRFHQVEVDEDVFQFVKKNAEPLVDNFNSVLRRLLPLCDTQLQKNKVLGINPPPSGTTKDRLLTDKRLPQALRHILDVARLVHGGAYTRTMATQYVARQYNVFPQTILDKYCRQLSLTAAQFDRLLEQPGLEELRKKLKSKFSSYSREIDEALC